MNPEEHTPPPDSTSDNYVLERTLSILAMTEHPVDDPVARISTLARELAAYLLEQAKDLQYDGELHRQARRDLRDILANIEQHNLYHEQIQERIIYILKTVRASLKIPQELNTSTEQRIIERKQNLAAEWAETISILPTKEARDDQALSIFILVNPIPETFFDDQAHQPSAVYHVLRQVFDEDGQPWRELFSSFRGMMQAFVRRGWLGKPLMNAILKRRKRYRQEEDF